MGHPGGSQLNKVFISYLPKKTAERRVLPDQHYLKTFPLFSSRLFVPELLHPKLTHHLPSMWKKMKVVIFS
jgi:hypothetical protein